LVSIRLIDLLIDRGLIVGIRDLRRFRRSGESRALGFTRWDPWLFVDERPGTASSSYWHDNSAALTHLLEFGAFFLVYFFGVFIATFRYFDGAPRRAGA
jgi:hypothetical protein